MASLSEVRERGEIRVIQDGVRDASSNEYRADESGGWIWEAAYALEDALVATMNSSCWETRRVLELGSGTGYLALRIAKIGARVVATDREGALPRIMRNICKNQQRFMTAAGEQALDVECASLDWEDALVDGDDNVADDSISSHGPWDLLVGSDLIYMHEMHEPLLATIARHAGTAPTFLSWEQRKPDEEARFLELAAARGFACHLVHTTTSSVNGAPITVHCMQRAETSMEAVNIAATSGNADTVQLKLLSLPPDLLRAILSHLDVSSLLNCTAVTHAMRTEATADSLWRDLSLARWPQWTLLTLSDEAVATWPRAIDQYALRSRALTSSALTAQSLVVQSQRTFVFRGSARDSYDGNTTPMLVTLSRAPASGICATLGIAPHRILAEVAYDRGSLHNVPEHRTWLGELKGAAGGIKTAGDRGTVSDDRPSQDVETARPAAGVPAVPAAPAAPAVPAGPDVSEALDLEWREHSSTFGHWIYRGSISRDGRAISGRYSLNVLPRKWGTFTLLACDPAPMPGLVPSPQQLAGRVVVRWAKKSLDKRVAQAEVISGAAHLH